MNSRISGLAPARPFLIWLAIALSLTLAYAAGAAAVLGFRPSAVENGALEGLQIVVLVFAAVVFLATAVLRAGPGAPVLAMAGLVFGFMALREFEAPFDEPVLLHLAGTAVRVRWTALTLGLAVLLAVRDRRWTIKAHFGATRAMWAPLIGAIILVVLGSFVEESTVLAGLSSSLIPVLEWAEETLELSGYVAGAVTAVWMARIRRTPPA